MLFKQAMDEAGLPMPRGGFVNCWEDASRWSKDRISGDHSTVVHTRRHRRRHCLQPGRV